jgi:hypothetical protein
VTSGQRHRPRPDYLKIRVSLGNLGLTWRFSIGQLRVYGTSCNRAASFPMTFQWPVEIARIQREPPWALVRVELECDSRQSFRLNIGSVELLKPGDERRQQTSNSSGLHVTP